MALIPQFTVSQCDGCQKVEFKDTTGDYDATTNPGGYGAPNIDRAAVTGTYFTITPRNGSPIEVNKNYLPNPDGATVDILNTDLGYSDDIPTKCYEWLYEVFANDIASGNVVSGKRYMVVDTNAPGGYITYDGTQYYGGQVFTATSTTTYTESDPNMILSEVVGSADNNVFYFCGLRECIKSLMLLQASEKQLKFDFLDELVNMDVELNAAHLAFLNNMTDCACEGLESLFTRCSDFINNCCR